MAKTKIVGYKIIFSTELSYDDVEDAVDTFLRDVDAKEMMAHAAMMTPGEIAQEMNK